MQKFGKTDDLQFIYLKKILAGQSLRSDHDTKDVQDWLKNLAMTFLMKAYKIRSHGMTNALMYMVSMRSSRLLCIVCPETNALFWFVLFLLGGGT